MKHLSPQSQEVTTALWSSGPAPGIGLWPFPTHPAKSEKMHVLVACLSFARQSETRAINGAKHAQQVSRLLEPWRTDPQLPSRIHADRSSASPLP